MKTDPWMRLVDLARSAPARPLPEAPHGFAARVVAAARRADLVWPPSVLAALLPRTLATAAIVLLGALVWHFAAVTPLEWQELSYADSTLGWSLWP